MYRTLAHAFTHPDTHTHTHISTPSQAHALSPAHGQFSSAWQTHTRSKHKCVYVCLCSGKPDGPKVPPFRTDALTGGFLLAAGLSPLLCFGPPPSLPVSLLTSFLLFLDIDFIHVLLHPSEVISMVLLLFNEQSRSYTSTNTFIKKTYIGKYCDSKDHIQSNDRNDTCHNSKVSSDISVPMSPSPLAPL